MLLWAFYEIIMIKYRSEIDGLRAIAVLPVIFFHAGFNLFSGGFVGVDIFFVISGYLITSILVSELDAGNFSIIRFYDRRARRILPALFLIMFVCIPFAWFWLLPRDMKAFSESLAAVSVFSSNILFWRTTGYFDAATELKPLIHTWSLSVEEQYYVLFPLMLLLSWRIGKIKVFYLLAAITSISLAFAHWGAFYKPTATFYLLPSRAWELLIGALVAFYYTEHNIKKHKHWHSELGSLFGFLLIIYSIFFFTEQTPFPSLYALAPTIGTALILVFSTHKTKIGKFLGCKPLVFLGLISYSTYLWHQPIFAFARHKNLDEPNIFLMITLVVATVLLGYLTWRFVERPFRNRHYFSRKQVCVTSIICTSLFIFFGVTGILKNGYSTRFSSQVTEISSVPDDGRLDNCIEEIQRTEGITCVIGDATLKPSVALVGDSHSTRLTNELSKRLKLIGISANVYAQSDCPPLIDVASDNPRKSPKCRKYRDYTFSEIQSDKNIRDVILVAEWPNYTNGGRINDFNATLYTDSQSMHKNLNENVAVVNRGLKRTIILLDKINKNIILVKSVPEYRNSVPQILSKRLVATGRANMGSDTVNYQAYHQRNQEFDSIIKNNGLEKIASIINPFDILCPQGTCNFIDENGYLFYVDSNHLTAKGSEQIVDAIVRSLLQKRQQSN